MNKEFSKQVEDMRFSLQDMTLRMSELLVKSELNLQICYNILNTLEGDNANDTKKTN
jgi:hypothetical protein